MSARVCFSAFVLSLVVALVQPAAAQTSGPSGEKKDTPASTESKSAASSPPAYQNILKDAPPKSGLWTVYQKGQNLYWEIGSGDYSAEYIVLISISRGIGQ